VLYAALQSFAWGGSAVLVDRFRAAFFHNHSQRSGAKSSAQRFVIQHGLVSHQRSEHAQREPIEFVFVHG
jgi:hypothetical protein